ncbi:MAG: Plug domain-containing protein, partial [Steroidobacteraceae bacterium]
MAKHTALVTSQVLAALICGNFTGVSLAAESSSAPEKVEFDEIIVTARRVEERQLTVPLTVNSLAGDQLDKLQIRTTDDLASKVPSVQLDLSDPVRANTFRIRGIGPTFLGDPGVINYVAEVPQTFYGGA